MGVETLARHSTTLDVCKDGMAGQRKGGPCKPHSSLTSFFGRVGILVGCLPGNTSIVLVS